jgi:hypothetical protein
MKITGCVPLPGQGLVARYGDLVAVTDGRGPGADPLLSALSEVAATTRDGSDLVRRAARAALGCSGQPAWACAGVTAEGGVAVLVHGHAVAAVRMEDGREITLTASDSVIPVSRTFAGATVTLALTAGDPPAPDPRFWLGCGVVPGVGLAVTVTAAPPEPALSDPAAPEPAGTQQAVAAPAPVVSEAVVPAVAVPAAVVPAAADPGGPVPLEAGPAAVAVEAVEAGPWTGDSPAASAGDGLADAAGSGETWYPVPQPAGLDESHPPTLDTSAAGSPAGAPGSTERPPSVLVDGALCPREHFNDPGARVCRQCGTTLDQPPRNIERRPRPPLGVLVLDDGTRITLDGDYVLGREPVLDGDVMAGRARPLRISDPEGTVSRLHLRVSLVGWQVEVNDLGSANGSVLQYSGEERTLAPFEPAVLEPGAWIGIGHRSMQYLSSQGVLP